MLQDGCTISTQNDAYKSFLFMLDVLKIGYVAKAMLQIFNSSIKNNLIYFCGIVAFNCLNTVLTI